MFKPVKLPNVIPGRLYLHGMPGRYEEWDDFITEAKEKRIGTIVCLTSEEEIKEKSPAYVKAIEDDTLPCPREAFPIPDYEVPQNLEDYAAFVEKIAGLLRSGDAILVHCGAGIGRTGTFAICLLLSLGVNAVEAEEAIKTAGSKPETNEQDDLVSWCIENLGRIE